MMPVLIIVMYVILPKNLKGTKLRRALVALFGVFAILAFTAMISAPKLWNNYFTRNTIDYTALVLFMITASVILVFVIRCMLVYIAIRARAWPAARLLLNDGLFVACSLICSLIFLVNGTIHFNNVKTIIRDVNLTDGRTKTASQTTIALLADLHLGAGANNELVDSIVESLGEQQPDIIVIAGDLTDMTTLYDDLHYFTQKISNANVAKYGIYYAEGNHEAESNIDVRKELEAFGITCLYDEATELENGIVIAGRRNSMEESVEDILIDSSVRKDAPVVVLSHRPVKLAEMSDKDYLVLCGHTHGYTIPFYGLIMPFVTDLPYGYHEFGELKAITTAGCADWGYRLKWPSYNEIWMIRLIY